MAGKVADEFGGRIRIRVCGICLKEGKVLMVNHSGVYGHDFWAPPGGGVNFGESSENTLKREFIEECKTEIRITNFLFGCEFIRSPFHALELFYAVDVLHQPVLGNDPEMVDHQVISDLRFMGSDDIKQLSKSHRHGIFNHVEKPSELMKLSGFYSLA